MPNNTDTQDVIVERGKRLGFTVEVRHRAHTNRAHYVMTVGSDGQKRRFDWDGAHAASAFLTGWDMRGKMK